MHTPSTPSGVQSQHALPGDAGVNAASVAEAVLAFVTSIKTIRCRDGTIVAFDPATLARSLEAAFVSAGMTQEKDVGGAHRVASQVMTRLQRRFDGHATPTTDDVRGLVNLTLIDANLIHVAKKYLEAAFAPFSTVTQPAVYGTGLTIQRLYTTPGAHPYNLLEWERRDASITNEKGHVVFEQKNVDVPKTYSQTATNIIVSKYFRGRLGTPERETSMRQVVDRIAQTITAWGRYGGYFATEEDANAYEMELTSILVNQRAAFNSPVWFNVGVNPHPQCSACFINSVRDDMRSILTLAVTEGMLFKYGSGTGSNLSWLRSSKEPLSNSSGKSSGPVSFMRGWDAFAGVIKSGGKTRRAAKMVILDVQHPDVKEFVWCKAKEEKKAHALIDAGYPGDLNGEAYGSIFFQNANNSVRVTDEFMQAAADGKEFWTRYVTTNDPCEKFYARDLLHEIADAAWQCGDPGMQYDSTINRWHTCPNTDRIYASNPCSEYMFLNDSACNLASVNLMKCRKPNGDFDVAAYEHVCRMMTLAQEIIVGFSSYPTPAIEQNSYDYRPLGLGYANLGSLLMAMGLPYDSDAGRNIAAAISSILSGVAYDQSALIAEKLGPFTGFARNRDPMLNVMRMHREAASRINMSGVPAEVLQRAHSCWDEAVEHGEKFGYRNSQISVIAPTGTISFLMDCATTGIEPDIALVKYKWLVGGGMLKIVNDTIPEALHRLGYTEAQIREIIDYIEVHDTIEGAPHLTQAHLPVFDCAFKANKGIRSIHYNGHMKMMAAVQPFISGAISKTVNLPHEATVEDIMRVYHEGWQLGLKAIAIYRDGCKRSQPLTTTREEVSASSASVGPRAHLAAPRRRRLPDERRSLTHKFDIGGHEGYLTVGLYDDGSPGEIFISMSKEGSTLAGLLDAFAISVSIGLQYGVPIQTLVKKFSHVRFEPSGYTQHENIRMAKSVIDYIFRWLALKFLSPEESQAAGINFPASVEPSASHAAQASAVASQPVQTTLLTPTQNAYSLTATIDNQSDAPACDTCGSIMVRNAACYKCLNCGATSGCS